MMQSDIEQHEGRMPALLEGEHAERAARRVVQWAMGPLTRLSLHLMLLLVVGGAVVAIMISSPDSAIGASVQFGLLTIAGLYWMRHHDRAWRVFVMGDAAEVLRGFSVESLRAQRIGSWRALERGGLLVTGICAIGLSLIWTIPALAPLRESDGSMPVGVVLMRCGVLGLMPALLGRMWLWDGGNDEEIEAQRRKVLGEDWFPG